MSYVNFALPLYTVLNQNNDVCNTKKRGKKCLRRSDVNKVHARETTGAAKTVF